MTNTHADETQTNEDETNAPDKAGTRDAVTKAEPHLSGLLPVGVFLVLFIGSGVVLNDFYSMPAIVAFVCALGSIAFTRTTSR